MLALDGCCCEFCCQVQCCVEGMRRMPVNRTRPAGRNQKNPPFYQ
jgi:hypothetical protein